MLVPFAAPTDIDVLSVADAFRESGFENPWSLAPNLHVMAIERSDAILEWAAPSDA